MGHNGSNPRFTGQITHLHRIPARESPVTTPANTYFRGPKYGELTGELHLPSRLQADVSDAFVIVLIPFYPPSVVGLPPHEMVTGTRPRGWIRSAAISQIALLTNNCGHAPGLGGASLRAGTAYAFRTCMVE